MHFFAYEDRSLTYRRKSESLLKVVNKAVWAVQLATALVGIILIVISAEDMFTQSPLAAGAALRFTARYRQLFASNCSTTTLVDTFILRAVPFTVNSGNIEFLISLYVNRVASAIVVASFACLISLVNKIIFDLNLFYYHKNYLIVRKDIVSCIEVCFLCGSIAANSNAHSFAEPLQRHVDECGGPDFLQGSKNFFNAGNFAPLYIAATLPLALHLCCWIMLFMNTVVHDTVDPPPTEAEALENTGDEPMPDASKQKAPQEVAELEREQAILEGKAPPPSSVDAADRKRRQQAAALRIQDRPSAAIAVGAGGGGYQPRPAAAGGEALPIGPGGLTDLAALAYGKPSGVVDSPARAGGGGAARVMRAMNTVTAFNRTAGVASGARHRFGAPAAAAGASSSPGSRASPSAGAAAAGGGSGGGADAFDPSATPQNNQYK